MRSDPDVAVQAEDDVDVCRRRVGRGLRGGGGIDDAGQCRWRG